ncbi:ABC transporter substrate-binding protein [Martelella mediterranea]|uniref:Carbohydrate ABC transporter, N-acetylglucosamine/diacetylchitobiose-binding protein n=1 Tax=Martelella mediterranea DSM 17316 TaxID=1122214 RepID=A0A1U9Z9R4_9HYPH|nr:ABC transporter substrate-binding protein [Martelella mediterranea]AQZ54435.1 carbohydrate ABC transporter, N-acetylglucosamine/diacetylchitobiose-binding protein [Martelella mediterranea DSM 17316]
MSNSHNGWSRRGFLGLAGATAAGLASGASFGLPARADEAAIKFWDMPWGGTTYNNAMKDLVEGYAGPGGRTATYQTIQWANFQQVFASALASNTGPAASTGGAFQAFQFAKQGQVLYADGIIDKLRESGKINDFLPGTLEALKTKDGYVGIPWNLDVRPIWVRTSLLEKAGVEAPKDWASWLTAGKALKKNGVYAFATGAGPNNNFGYHGLVSLMINNAGGLFNENQEPDALYDRNVEAMEFVREMASEGLIDPASVSYSTDNLDTMWRTGKVAIGYHTPGLDKVLGETDGDLVVMSPPEGPHGDKGTAYYVNNIMMYANNPSTPDTEEFLVWYVNNLAHAWTVGKAPTLPALKSITETEEFRSRKQAVKVIEEWQPVCKPMAARSTASFAALASIDAGQAVTRFTQTMLAGRTDAKKALERLQSDLEDLM